MNYEIRQLGELDFKKLFSFKFGQKATSLLVIFGLVLSIATPIVFYPTYAEAAAVTLFSDNFDSPTNSILTNKWFSPSGETGATREISPSAVSGRGIKLAGDVGASREIATMGYAELTVQYSRIISEFESPDQFEAEYMLDDGTPVSLETLTSNQAHALSSVFTISNPDRKTKLTIHFYNNSNNSSDNVGIDNLVVTGDNAPNFYDGFESGANSTDFTPGGWTTSETPTIQTEDNDAWTDNNTATPEGRSAEIDGSSNASPDDAITKSFSTVGLENIKVRYARFVEDMENSDGDIFKVRYTLIASPTESDWTNFETLNDDNDNDPYESVMFSLPSGANNNSNFQIRFEMNGDSSSDNAFVDDVVIWGDEIDVTAPIIIINNPNTTPAQSKILTASASDGTLTMSITTGSVCDGTLTFVPYDSTAFTSESDNNKKICYKAVDASSNTAYSLSNAIEGIDTTAPVIEFHSNITNEATSSVGATVNYTAPNATDNIDATVVATCTPASGSIFALTTTLVTCNKTDVAGNVATSTNFNITVVDTTKPVIALDGSNPQIILVGNVYTELGATITDNYDTSFSLVINDGAVNVNTLGSYSVTYDVTDSSGNIADQVIRTVNVVDQEAPVINLTGAIPQIIEVHTPYTELGALVTDNVDTGLTATIDATSVNVNVVGSYSVTYNATDLSSNDATEVTRTVNVVDTTKPVITLNGSSSITIKIGDTYTEQGATATDNYDAIVVVTPSGTVNTSIVATYTVTYTATDANGNTQITTRDVIVRPLATDASLSALSTSQGTLVSPFETAILAYTVTLPFGSTITPTTLATPTDANATAVITNATNITSVDSLNRTTTVVVTAEDGVTTKNYTIIFSVALQTITTGKITVIKEVINNNGKTKIASQFSLFVGETSVATGVQNEFAPGTYNIHETADSNYTILMIDGDCNAQGNITLTAGDVKTCRIVNDDNAPESSGGGGGGGPMITYILGNINKDGKVDVLDLAILFTNWGASPTNANADVNKDGVVNIIDFSILMVNWTI